MTYKGHIQNGAIVLDEPAPLVDGFTVRVELVPSRESFVELFSLRGLPYEFEDPFTPVTTESDWDAAK